MQHQHPDPSTYSAALQREELETSRVPGPLYASLPLLLFVFALFVWLSPRRG